MDYRKERAGRNLGLCERADRMKKGLDLGGMIDTAATPKETGIPQRGARPRKVKAERRSDQMSVRMKPSTRALIESLADAEGVPIAEIVERAIAAYADATSPEWANGLDLLPDHMVDGMVRYILRGIPPGSFLTAVLAGDLFTALRKADDFNISALPAYGRFLHNYAPAGCFGTADRVDAWIERGGLAGKKEDAA